MTESDKQRIRLLTDSILIPIRLRFGAIIIKSGKRDEVLNEAVGGSLYSQHLSAEASDIKSPNADNWSIFKWVAKEKLPYRQIIYYEESEALHLSINVPGLQYKNEALIKRKSGEWDTWAL